MTVPRLDLSDAALEAKAAEQGEQITETPSTPEVTPQPPSTDDGAGSGEGLDDGGQGETPPAGDETGGDSGGDTGGADGKFWGKFADEEAAKQAHSRTVAELHEARKRLAELERGGDVDGLDDDDDDDAYDYADSYVDAPDPIEQMRVAEALERRAQTNPQEAAAAALQVGRADVYDRIMDQWEAVDPDQARKFERQVQSWIAQQQATAAAQEQMQQFQQQQQQEQQGQRAYQAQMGDINTAAVQFKKSIGDEAYNQYEQKVMQVLDEAPQLLADASATGLLNGFKIAYQTVRYREQEAKMQGAQQKVAQHGQQQRRNAHAERGGGQFDDAGGASGDGEDYEAEGAAVLAGIRRVNQRKLPDFLH